MTPCACLCVYKAVLDSHWGWWWRGRCVCFGSDSAFHIPLWYSVLWPQETRPTEKRSLFFANFILSLQLLSTLHVCTSLFSLSQPSFCVFKFEESCVTHTAGLGLYYISDWNPPTRHLSEHWSFHLLLSLWIYNSSQGSGHSVHHSNAYFSFIRRAFGMNTDRSQKLEVVPSSPSCFFF